MTLSKLSTEVSTKKSHSLHHHRAVKSPRPLVVTIACPFACQRSMGERSERYTVGIIG